MKWYRRAGACTLLPVIGLVFALATMSGQTRLDLRSQTKNVDFSNASSTRPFPIGTVLPATCRVGETWFNPNAPAGQNLYICAATNIWSAIQVDEGSAPFSTVRSLGAGPNLNITCTSGTEATTGLCTLALDTSNLASPDSNNVLSGITSFPATPVQNLSATSTILCNATRVTIAASSPVTLTSTPVIADPTRDGQVCILQNTGSSDITLTSGTAQNLKLANPTVALKAGQPLMLIWDQTTSLWTQQIQPAQEALAVDSNNIVSGVTAFPATPIQNLSAASAIACDATRVAVSASSAVTLTSTPVIADPTRDGQVCILQNTGPSDITLTSGTAQNLKLANPTVALKAGQPLMLIWDQTTSLWTQQIQPAPVPDSNNIVSGVTAYPATPVQNLSATSAIACDATRVAVSSFSAVTLTSTPVIADPTRDGQVCILQNTGSSDITLTSGTAENLKLANATVALKAGQPLMLIWDQTTSLWAQATTLSTPQAAPTWPLDLGSGGSTTPYTNSLEQPAGSAPNFGRVIPANTLTTGKWVTCRAVIEQHPGANGTHEGSMQTRVYLNSTLIGTTMTDPSPADIRTTYILNLYQHANGTQSLRVESIRNSGSMGEIIAGTTSLPASGDMTIEFRPRMGSINDDSFSVQMYACEVH